MMTAYILQTLLLLGLAYFAGCAVACMLRRLVSGDRVARPAARAAVPQMAVPAAPKAAPQTAPQPAQAPVPAAAPQPGAVRPPPVLAPANVPRAPAAQPAQQPVRDAFRRADTLEPTEKPAQARPAQPAAAPPNQAASSNVSRFERALTTPNMPTAVPAPVAAPPAAAPPVAAPPVARAAPPPVATPAAMPPVRPAPAPAVAAPAAPPPVAAKPMTPAPVAAPPVAAAAAAPRLAPLAPAAAAPAQPVATTRPDDLKRIRAIDAMLETELNRHGIRRYADIAQWRTEDVQRISQALGFKGRIEQENWIEQAQILARGEETFYSRRLARGEAPSARPVADEGERKPVSPAAAPTAPIPERPRTTAEAAAAAAAAVAAANRMGAPPAARPAPAAQAGPSAPQAAAANPPRVVLPEVMRPMVEDRAAFARSGVAPPPQPQPQAQAQPPAAAPPAARVAPPAQQAPVVRPAAVQTPLAQGPAAPGQAAPPAQQAPVARPAGPAAPAAVRPQQSTPPQAAPVARPAAPPQPQGQQPQAPAPAARPVMAGAFAAASAGAAAAAAAAAAGSAMSRPAIGSGRDNLQRIGGISAEVEKALNAQGMTRYSQIANWGASDTERYDRLFGNQGRIQRENWVEQAQILAKGGDTAYSREYDRREAESLRNAEGTRPARLAEAVRPADASAAAAPAPRANDLSSLRSVRSEGLRTPVAGGQARSGQPDDLKRIRGIGVLIEKKLNSMGITHYEQIANWSAADIDRVSHVLDFKGRIERENWVEQARILSTGGQTEFSRRADREGEPEA